MLLLNYIFFDWCKGMVFRFTTLISGVYFPSLYYSPAVITTPLQPHNSEKISNLEKYRIAKCGPSEYSRCRLILTKTYIYFKESTNCRADNA